MKIGPSAFDPMLLHFAATEVRPGMNVWDVGANVGIFAFAAAHLALPGRVVAVEPDPFLVELLRRTKGLTANVDLNVIVVPCAISDRVGTTRLKIAMRGRAANAITDSPGSSQMGGVRAEVTVPTLRLDDLLVDMEAPNIVKIDVETAEHLVLRGAMKLLGEARPVILIEVASANAAEVGGLFTQYDYALFDGKAPEPRATPISNCIVNTLAIPREKVG